VLIEPCLAIMALFAVQAVFPEPAVSSSVSVTEVAGFLLTHPFWTLVGAVTLVVVIPRLVKVCLFAAHPNELISLL
jgi:hypothetical protein